MAVLHANGGGHSWVPGGPEVFSRTLRESEYRAYAERGCDPGSTACGSVAHFSLLSQTQYVATLSLIYTAAIMIIMVLGVAVVTRDAERLVRWVVHVASQNILKHRLHHCTSHTLCVSYSLPSPACAPMSSSWHMRTTAHRARCLSCW